MSTTPGQAQEPAASTSRTLTDWAAADRARRLAEADRLVEEALTQLAIGQGSGGLSFHELQDAYDTLERAAAAIQEVRADEPR